MKERFRALMDASAKRPGRPEAIPSCCAPPCWAAPWWPASPARRRRACPTAAYWATLSLSDCGTQGEEGIELLLSLAEVDTDTMTLLSVALDEPPVAERHDVRTAWTAFAMGSTLLLLAHGTGGGGGRRPSRR